jgi:hypothetical protein
MIRDDLDSPFFLNSDSLTGAPDRAIRAARRRDLPGEANPFGNRHSAPLSTG